MQQAYKFLCSLISTVLLEWWPWCLSFLRRLPARLWWTLPIIGIVLIFTLFYMGKLPMTGDDLAQRGQFGDSFGALTSLFTGLGFGGLIITLTLQQKQIAQNEKEVVRQRRSEEKRHYEETLHRLLSLYSKTLEEVSNADGTLRGRTTLRGSTDRVFHAVKSESANIIPVCVQERYLSERLTDEDALLLDYLYFRNFKILAVEIDRQGRLVETLKVLLRHLVYEVPDYLLVRPYCELVCAQITFIEVSYFFLVALTFKDESELRDLFVRSTLVEKAAHIKRLKIHDYMFKQFWGENVREYKTPIEFPISDTRINNAVRSHRRGQNRLSNHRGKMKYASPRSQQK